MRSSDAWHISAREWRWVVLVSSALVLLAFSPFLWVVSNSVEPYQFMGALHDYENAAAHLSRIAQGAEGFWLARYIHTPEPHSGVLVDVIYLLLGQIARLTQIPTIIIFHIARIGAALFMYMAIYYLGASIWTRTRPRRIFFVLAVLGSGLGWLLTLLNRSPETLTLLLDAPGITPFESTLANVHLPLVIACLCVLASAMIDVLRPGTRQVPTVGNSGIIILVFSLLITLIYPQALLPVGIAFVGLIVSRMIRARRIENRYSRWILWFVVPALPVMAYYVVVLYYNPVVLGLWGQANQTPSPSVFEFFVGLLGLPLLIAVPALYRAFRRFEPDGNQFMLVWLLAMMVLTALVPTIRLNFAVGIMVVIAYFATRSIEDFWLERIARPWRMRVALLLLPLLTFLHLIVLFAPIFQITISYGDGEGLLLPQDYARAFRWLGVRSQPTDVVLAAPRTSLWLPAWSGQRVVYGSATETLNPAEKSQAVIDWYAGNDASCRALLNGRYSEVGSYRVRYVIYGPEEREFGAAPCLEALEEVVRFNTVAIYAYTGENFEGLP